MSIAVIATVFVVVLLAELPDKSALASIMLGTRYRAWQVFIGVAAAFTTHVVIAVAAGKLISLLPHRPVQFVVAGLFAIGAALLLWRSRPGRSERDGAEAETVDPGSTPNDGSRDQLRCASTDRGEGTVSVASPPEQDTTVDPVKAWKAIAASFGVIFLAEFGDLTQILIANLSARYDSPLAVGLGSAAALWVVAGIAVLLGNRLSHWINLTWLSRLAALVMLGLAALTLLEAL